MAALAPGPPAKASHSYKSVFGRLRKPTPNKTPNAKPSPSNLQPFPFLDLPPEIRIQIYHHLHWWEGSPAYLSGAFSPQLVRIDPQWSTTLKPKCHFHDLLSLMRTSRQLHTEASAVLYSIPFGFPSLGALDCRKFNLTFLCGGSPACNLRRVFIALSVLRYERDAWPPTNMQLEGDEAAQAGGMPYHEAVLWALAKNARQLETLEILYPYRRPFSREKGVEGIPVKREWSWMDPMLEYLPGNPERRGLPRLTEERHVRAVLECLAPGDEVVQGRIREKMEEGFALADQLQSHNFWGFVWFRLWDWEAQKGFWAGEIMEILKEFSPTLRVVSLKGGVDRKWMQAVANLRGVEVRAIERVKGAEWVTVRPGGVYNNATF
ncbi:hypothetical protein B0T16DRAFT_514513 [Cercophora newfieldiana]|uniref:Uncharacterized protein n=1 Tax=Cercophora newfieldiana TaxID=92897 RepID=A0AA39XX08_9PEZI|nr:hypothetical protein B0T16DRAFT_514513 [Cercophora newfieldiana]